MSVALKKKMEGFAVELRGARQELKTWLDKKGPDGTIDVDAAGRDKINELNAKCTDLEPKYRQAKEDWVLSESNAKSLDELTNPQVPLGIFAARGGDGVGHDMDGVIKNLGDLFVESGGYQAFLKAKDVDHLKLELAGANLKTVFQRSAGYSPFVTRQPGFVPFAQQQPKLIDMIPLVNTNEAGIKYMVHTLNTNNAAMVAEGGQFPESAYQLSEVYLPVQKIAHFIPVTDEQLADVAGARDFLNVQLELGAKQALERQIIAGDGTGNNLTGFLKVAGLLNQPQGADNVQDAFFKAMVQVQTVGFADPTAIWMNPLDWQNIRLYKTSQGLYLWGNPDQSGPQRMWGLPVVATTYFPQGKGLTGDFSMYSCLWMRAGYSTKVSDSHADWFIKGIQAIRGELRACLVVTRGPAFCTVGIGQAAS